MPKPVETKPTLDDPLWSEEQALSWLTQNPTRKDSVDDEAVNKEQQVVRHSSNGATSPKDRVKLLIERREGYFGHPLTAQPLLWVWLAISSTPRTATTFAARRELSKWIGAKLLEGYVPCLKFKSEKPLLYDGMHNGYPVYHLALLVFMHRHRDASANDWEVTFTRIREEAPPRDALDTKPPKRRDGGSSGCDRFVRVELKKLARDGSGAVVRLGANRENPRQYRLGVHRSALADALQHAPSNGDGYSKQTILKSLSKLAVSPKGPAR